MNAYELADQVEMWGEDLLALNMKGGIPVVQGAKMLRQQADRIAELEKQGEPVAWLNGNEICPEIDYEATITTQHPKDLGWKPLYLAPQTKPLSDGEIDESFDRTASHMANEYVSHYEPTAWINHIKQTGGDFYELNVSGRGEPLYRHPPQTKPLSDEVLNKAFDYYCETDEGVLRFDFELRAEWKQEQLKRWKEAFRKAWD